MIKQYRMSRKWEEGSLLEKGFTLIELLIVIVVLGIFAATVDLRSRWRNVTEREGSLQSDAKSVEVAIEASRTRP